VLKKFQHITKFKASSIPPANTGKDNNNRTAVTITAQPNNGTLCNTWPGIRIFITVVIKFIALYKFI